MNSMVMFMCIYDILPNILLELYHNILYFLVAVSSVSKMLMQIAVSVLLITFVLVSTSPYVKQIINKTLSFIWGYKW
jgi:hypothetical protein